jgi:hypothetical protein
MVCFALLRKYRNKHWNIRIIWENSRQVSEANGHLPIVFLQLHSTEISRTIRIISRWVWETNKSSTFTSLQLPFTQTLRVIEAYTLKVWVGNLWSSVDFLSFVCPTSHRQIIPRLSSIFLNVFAAAGKTQLMDYRLPVRHPVGYFQQIKSWYFSLQ